MDTPLISVVLKGTTASGLGRATGFTQFGWVQQEFERKLGFHAWPGTFNLRVTDLESQVQWSVLTKRSGIAIEPPDSNMCVACCFPTLVNGAVYGAIVLPHVPNYPKDQIEILAAENLRTRLGLTDGDPVSLEVLDWPEQ